MFVIFAELQNTPYAKKNQWAIGWHLYAEYLPCQNPFFGKGDRTGRSKQQGIRECQVKALHIVQIVNIWAETCSRMIVTVSLLVTLNEEDMENGAKMEALGNSLFNWGGISISYR